LTVIIYKYNTIRSRDGYISLAEVIPEARIVSYEDGIVEYKGKKFILGLDNLKKKKEFIQSLKLLELKDTVEIDMRFSSQIILRRK